MESFADLGLLMVLSLVLVYLVMASQFESLKMPFIIMFSIPSSFSGSCTGTLYYQYHAEPNRRYRCHNAHRIVVKNAITVLVDYINLMRDRGLELYEAVAVSGKSRLRPVLMTSLTTILGMLPLALSVGEGSEIWSPMGISVIGGLVFSTLVTLVLVPVVYVIFSRRGERNKKKMVMEAYDFLNE
ncbi:MAG: efflux RND transporter permease subunit [Bacteroidales bacterium]